MGSNVINLMLVLNLAILLSNQTPTYISAKRQDLIALWKFNKTLF